MQIRFPRRAAALAALAGVAAGLAATPAGAYELYNRDGDVLNADVFAMFGIFHSERSYNLGARSEDESASWREGFVRYGFSGTKALGAAGSAYGGVSLLSSATWGDGDAGGFTSGRERRTALEERYLGWRSGSLFPALGDDGVDFSFGRQIFTLGEGFLIQGDALNFGDAIDRVAGTDFDRGGAYWLAARKAFDRSAVLRLGGKEGLRADLFWLESDNKVQAQMELAGLNAEYVVPAGTVAASYIEGLGVDRSQGRTYRDGQQTLSLRAKTSAGIEQLLLSGEYVEQRQGDSTREDGDAWYLEGSWTFTELPWQPLLGYRYSSFDEGFDPLFFGFSRGYGTWFQGEVAANFAGPFNSDADVHYLRLELTASETLSFGANYFAFRDTAGGSGALDGRELDLYAKWTVSDNLIITPLLGFYKPKHDAAEGGSQIGGSGTNTYFHVLAVVPF